MFVSQCEKISTKYKTNQPQNDQIFVKTDYLANLEELVDAMELI